MASLAQNLPLFFENLVLVPEAVQFLPLVSGNAIALSNVYILLFQPVFEGFGSNPEIGGDLGESFIRGAGELDGFGPELRWVGGIRPSGHVDSFLGALLPSLRVSTQPT